MRAYLDTNIIASIENQDFSLEKIIDIDKKIVKFPYSAAHIQEASNIVGTERIKLRLDIIRQVSKCNYIYEDAETRNMIEVQTDPLEVWDLIHLVPQAKSAINMFTNLFSHDLKNQLLIDLGIEINKINNYTPTEVIDHLNCKIKLFQNTSMIGLVEQAVSFFPNGNSFGLHNRMAAMIEFIDMLGYWRDKQTDKSNTARFWDANHAFYASYCDYFISDDKRNRNKCRVVYEIYGIDTKIYSSNGI